MNYKFTFGILAYNHENVIVQALNSIKFQIIEYGKDIKCKLIITDDSSSDMTQMIIDDWLSINESIFCKVIKKYNDENLGTVDNYHFIIDQIDDEPFKIIAGDDILSFNNIFSIAETLGKHTLYNGFRLFFNDKMGVYYLDKYIQLHFWLRKSNLRRIRLIKLFRMGHIISTPQTLYLKKLYSDSAAEEFNSEFRIFEDNPTWYSILTNIEDVEVVFDIRNLTLYRISEEAISNRKIPNPEFKKELDRLYSFYMENGSFFEKLYFKSLINRIPAIFNFSKYVNRLFFLYCKVYSVIYRIEYNDFKGKILKQLELGKIHYFHICNMK